MSESKLTFTEAVDAAVDVIEEMEDQDLAINLVGALLAYVLQTFYEREHHHEIIDVFANHAKSFPDMDEEAGSA